MHNRSLAADYIRRAGNRLAALDVLFELESWADVVRESQEAVELALKALLRFSFIEVPRVHDVSQLLRDERDRLPESVHPHLESLAASSKSLRRDRELAFYGSEDLTPSDFYQRADAEQAREQARRVVEVVSSAIEGQKRKPGKRRSRKSG
jgi:HEPN domain-containing protein